MLASLTPLPQTLVGGAAAIIGGIAGALVTYRLTLRLLRRERQDDALLELITHTPYLRLPVENVLEQHRRDPATVIQTQGMASLNLRGWPEFRSRWLQYLSPRIDDGKIQAAFHRADRERAASEAVMAEESKDEPINPPGEWYWSHVAALAESLRDMQERAEVLLAKRSRWIWSRRRRRQ